MTPGPDPPPIRGRMTLGRPDCNTPWVVVGPGIARQAGWETFEVAPWPPVPDEAAIERGAKAHAAYLGENWDELDHEERESRLCAFETGVRAALEAPEKP